MAMLFFREFHKIFQTQMLAHAIQKGEAPDATSGEGRKRHKKKSRAANHSGQFPPPLGCDWRRL